jgi:DNA-directed RNA polymerase specialized sigma24 family protein
VKNPLERLREIRDQQSAARALTPERDVLIRAAADEKTVRQIAEAAGLSPGRIHRIVRR